MSKWECTVCGYIYDPAEGDQHRESNREQLSKICLMIGFARSAASAKTCLKN